MATRMIHMVTVGIPGEGIEAHLFELHTERDAASDQLRAVAMQAGANIKIDHKDFLVPFEATKEDVSNGVKRAMETAMLRHLIGRLLQS